jgi:hypothetical protein
MLRRARALVGKLGSFVRGKEGSVRSEELNLAREEIAKNNRRLKKLRKRIEEKDRELAELRARVACHGTVGGLGGIEAENIIWIFGAGRTGSS